jgi:hypothetical protein
MTHGQQADLCGHFIADHSCPFVAGWSMIGDLTFLCALLWIELWNARSVRDSRALRLVIMNFRTFLIIVMVVIVGSGIITAVVAHRDEPQNAALHRLRSTSDGGLSRKLPISSASSITDQTLQMELPPSANLPAQAPIDRPETAPQSKPQKAPGAAASVEPPVIDLKAKELLGRLALSFAGADPEADEIWAELINDPELSAKTREDLIEDLNEEGFDDPRNLTEEDLPLIENRILLIEEHAAFAMDDVNAAAFAEAYKDLVNMWLLVTQR